MFETSLTGKKTLHVRAFNYRSPLGRFLRIIPSPEQGTSAITKSNLSRYSSLQTLASSVFAWIDSAAVNESVALARRYAKNPPGLFSKSRRTTRPALRRRRGPARPPLWVCVPPYSIPPAAAEGQHKAVQYAQGYGPIRVRSAIIPLSNIGSQLSIVFIFCWPPWTSG